MIQDKVARDRVSRTRDLLSAAGLSTMRSPAPLAVGSRVQLAVDQVLLEGELVVPAGAAGMIVFAHGSGSSRRSPRNRRVAAELQRSSLGTLLFDLLTPGEERIDVVTGAHRFDIDLLASRLVGVTDWVSRAYETRELPVGLFGASTGAAAALIAAARRPDAVGAVVSRGGRPDLAGGYLPKVEAPTLLVVGGRDEHVIELNRDALRRMTCEASLESVTGATHLFEEEGALERVAGLAAEWFTGHLE